MSLKCQKNRGGFLIFIFLLAFLVFVPSFVPSFGFADWAEGQKSQAGKENANEKSKQSYVEKSNQDNSDKNDKSVKKTKFPNVSQIYGLVSVQGKTETQMNLKKGDVFSEKAIVTVPANAQILIEFDEQSSLTVLDGSVVEIPVIAYETGDVSTINLIRGAMRYSSENQYQRVISTPVTKDIYTKVDMVIRYNPTLARAEMVVFKGHAVFRGQENEEEHLLAAGQKAYFNGVLEGGEPSYDVLLKGRRIARGRLSAPTELNSKDLEIMAKDTLVTKPKANEIKKRVKLPGEICENPFAKFNQCAWKCEGANSKDKSCQVGKKNIKCVRTRCNANGVWEDRFEYPNGDRCQPKQIITGTCDY